MHATVDFFLCEAAVGARNEVLAADARGEPRETIGDELGMFDDVRAVADDRLRAFPDVEIPGSAIIR